MVAVFAIFGTLRLIEFKQLGVGLSAAILIDATVIRGILLPATLALLGDRAWYLPRWLRWLPGGHAADVRSGSAAGDVRSGSAAGDVRSGSAAGDVRSGSAAGDVRTRPAISGAEEPSLDLARARA
jgi:hypothetical protein